VIPDAREVKNFKEASKYLPLVACLSVTTAARSRRGRSISVDALEETAFSGIA
jgi:hypothetical protein